MSGVPDVVGRVRITEKSSTDTYLVIENAAGLTAMVQLSMLEIHPWGSTVGKLETPDRITFDFDPDVGLPWEHVTAAAIEMREALAGIGLQSFAKTTGGKGLHVVVPVRPVARDQRVDQGVEVLDEPALAFVHDHRARCVRRVHERRPGLDLALGHHITDWVNFLAGFGASMPPSKVGDKFVSILDPR